MREEGRDGRRERQGGPGRADALRNLFPNKTTTSPHHKCKWRKRQLKMMGKKKERNQTVFASPATGQYELCCQLHACNAHLLLTSPSSSSSPAAAAVRVVSDSKRISIYNLPTHIRTHSRSLSNSMKRLIDGRGGGGSVSLCSNECE